MSLMILLMLTDSCEDLELSWRAADYLGIFPDLRNYYLEHRSTPAREVPGAYDGSHEGFVNGGLHASPKLLEAYQDS
jgi:hypothetical protein